MKRPLFVIGGVFACTTWAAFLFDYRTAILLSAAFSSTAVLFLLLLKKCGRLRLPCLILLSGALAMGSYCLYLQRAEVPFRGMEGETVELQGMILGKESWGRTTQYTVLGGFLGRPELPRSKMIVVSYGEEPAFQPGDTVRCLAKVTLPAGTAAAQYYRSQGIAVVGYLRGQAQPVQAAGFQPGSLLARARNRMQENLNRRLSPGHAQVLGAMVLGLQSGVDADTYTAVNRAGTSHLLAVSGLHLSIVTAFVLNALRRLRIPRALQSLGAIAAALVFAGLVGFSGSIMRALIMTSLMLLGGMLSRKSDSLNALGLSLLLICAVCPHWMLGKGLWLSAASTMGIVVFAPGAWTAVLARLRVKNRLEKLFLLPLAQAAVISVCAYAFALPVLLVSTGWVSVISPVANMLIAPFIMPVILGGILCALVPAAVFPVRVIARITDFCAFMILGISRLLSGLPFATAALDEFYMLILLAAFGTGGVLLYVYRADRRLTAYFLALCVLCASAGNLSLLAASKDRVELAVVERCDTAVLLRDGQAVILGAPTRHNVDRLMRYLDFRGVRSISAVIAPDYPEQVDSGLLRLQERYGISCVVGPDDAYILSTLERALPDSRIFSAGYAQVTLLDAAVLTVSRDSADITVQIGGNTILKKAAEYAIIEEYTPDHIEIYRGVILVLPAGTPPAVEPVGRWLYGEARVLLRIG